MKYYNWNNLIEYQILGIPSEKGIDELLEKGKIAMYTPGFPEYTGNRRRENTGKNQD